MITLQLPAGQQRHQQPQEGVTISDGDWSPPRHRHPEYPAHISRGFIRMLQPTIPAANIDHMNNGLTFHTRLCPRKWSLITIKPLLFYFLVIVLSFICKIVWQFRIEDNELPKMFILRRQRDEHKVLQYICSSLRLLGAAAAIITCPVLVLIRVYKVYQLCRLRSLGSLRALVHINL